MKLGTTFHRGFNTVDATGAKVDADALPTAVVMEDGVALAYAPTVADVGTGRYDVTVAATTGNGFEVGKSYVVHYLATIGGVAVEIPGPQFEVEAQGVDDLAAGADLDIVGAAVADVQTAVDGIQADLDNGTDGLGALMAAVTNLTGNTRASCALPRVLERPDAGSKTYRAILYLFDDAGNFEDPDADPTVTAQNDQGTDRSANLSAVTRIAAGKFRVDYTVAVAHALEGISLLWAWTEGGKDQGLPISTFVVELTAETFTAGDRTKLETIHGKLPVDTLPGLSDLPSEPPTAGAVADAVLDEALAGHAGAGTAGKALADAATQAAAAAASAALAQTAAESGATKVQRARKYFVVLPTGVDAADELHLHLVDPDEADDDLVPTVTGTLLLDQVIQDKDALMAVLKGTGPARVGRSAV